MQAKELIKELAGNLLIVHSAMLRHDGLSHLQEEVPASSCAVSFATERQILFKSIESIMVYLQHGSTQEKDTIKQFMECSGGRSLAVIVDDRDVWLIAPDHCNDIYDVAYRLGNTFRDLDITVIATQERSVEETIAANCLGGEVVWRKE